jgi:hypothetical protein
MLHSFRVAEYRAGSSPAKCKALLAILSDVAGLDSILTAIQKATVPFTIDVLAERLDSLHDVAGVGLPELFYTSEGPVKDMEALLASFSEILFHLSHCAAGTAHFYWTRSNPLEKDRRAVCTDLEWRHRVIHANCNVFPVCFDGRVRQCLHVGSTYHEGMQLLFQIYTSFLDGWAQHLELNFKRICIESPRVAKAVLSTKAELSLRKAKGKFILRPSLSLDKKEVWIGYHTGAGRGLDATKEQRWFRKLGHALPYRQFLRGQRDKIQSAEAAADSLRRSIDHENRLTGVFAEFKSGKDVLSSIGDAWSSHLGVCCARPVLFLFFFYSHTRLMTFRSMRSQYITSFSMYCAGSMCALHDQRQKECTAEQRRDPDCAPGRKAKAGSEGVNI